MFLGPVPLTNRGDEVAAHIDMGCHDQPASSFDHDRNPILDSVLANGIHIRSTCKRDVLYKDHSDFHPTWR